MAGVGAAPALLRALSKMKLGQQVPWKSESKSDWILALSKADRQQAKDLCFWHVGTADLRRKFCQQERCKFERKRAIGRQRSKCSNSRNPPPFHTYKTPSLLIELIFTLSVVDSQKNSTHYRTRGSHHCDSVHSSLFRINELFLPYYTSGGKH